MRFRYSGSTGVRVVVAATTALAMTGCGNDSEDVQSAPVAPAVVNTPTTTEQTGAANLAPGIIEQYETVNAEIAERGGFLTVGDYKIGYIVEAAEPWFHEGEHFREPLADETHHIEIIPFENATGRIVPSVPIKLEIIDPSGKVVDSDQLNFYYSTFFHYANNFSVPDAGSYTLKATLERPTFLRHGEEADGPPLNEGGVAEFKDVHLQPTSAETSGSGSGSGSGSASTETTAPSPTTAP